MPLSMHKRACPCLAQPPTNVGWVLVVKQWRHLCTTISSACSQLRRCDRVQYMHQGHTWRWSPTTTIREYAGSRRGNTNDDKNLLRHTRQAMVTSWQAPRVKPGVTPTWALETLHPQGAAEIVAGRPPNACVAATQYRQRHQSGLPGGSRRSSSWRWTLRR